VADDGTVLIEMKDSNEPQTWCRINQNTRQRTSAAPTASTAGTCGKWTAEGGPVRAEADTLSGSAMQRARKKKDDAIFPPAGTMIGEGSFLPEPTP
jgi:hypothetical protein